ncbi:MAG: hypothetical protein JXN63_03105 [Candidatus Delongbacteria bacterium]|nr:hypothetical protein [Candidatus Delongbacteria bacterium]
MKRISTILLSVIILLTIFAQKGCVKSTEPDTFMPGIEIITPEVEPESSYLQGQNIQVDVKLSDYTFEYSEVNFYLGSLETPAFTFTKDSITQLAQDQEKEAEFSVLVPTDGVDLTEVSSRRLSLTVEALSTYGDKVSDVRFVTVFIPEGQIDIQLIDPAGTDQVILGNPVTFRVTLTSPTGLNYFNELRYYLNGGMIEPEADLVQEGETYTFDYVVQTTNLDIGSYEFKVEMYSVGDQVVTGMTEFAVLEESSLINFECELVNPPDQSIYNIGERIEVRIIVSGDLGLFKNFTATVYDSVNPVVVYETTIADDDFTFSFTTEDFNEKSYELRLKLTNIENISHTKEINFSLIEYIPTWEIVDNLGVGYELKSLIQTYDDGYVALSSDEVKGTRVVKYDKEGALIWSTNITADIGVGMSICEDTDYDKGYAIAGWRMNTAGDKDTWVRKIDHTDGSLIWNKHYGFEGADDVATIIRRSVDDGFIVGGWSFNRWGTDSLSFTYIDPAIGPVEYLNVDTWETGYDVRFLKIYSNGNEVWGHQKHYDSHSDWYDISLHSRTLISGMEILWLRKMGDQFVTDIVSNDDGSYFVTGWNNSYLYNGITKKDMFYARIDEFGGFTETMTWAYMSDYDHSNPASGDKASDWRLTCGTFRANPLGSPSEDEAGYGLAVTQEGGYGGRVVMVGETYQDDDLPAKEKLHDAWLVEFAINADEDGALWEYALGEESKNEKAYSIDVTKDGCYIVTGYETGTNSDTWLFKLDSQLKVLWESPDVKDADADYGVKALQCSDRGFAIGGNVGIGAGITPRIIKVNKSGVFNVK